MDCNGCLKLLLGSFLFVLAVNHGVDMHEAIEPTQMYHSLIT